MSKKTSTPPLVAHALENFGGVEISGARWTGKSWTAASFSKSVTRVDDNYDIYLTDPNLAMVGDRPHTIDEWQDIPELWNLVRHAIDDNGNDPGQYILTGSSTPIEEGTRHSGAGRICRIRLRTMTLTETGESSAEASLAGLFEHYFEPTRVSMGLQQLSQIICRGGWPALQHHPRRCPETIIDSYLDTLFDISFVKDRKSPFLARQIARSLARNVATSASLGTIAADASEGQESTLNVKTIVSYLDAFKRNYVLDELPGWDAPIRSKSRLRTKPKRYFDDPSLAARLLGISPDRLLKDGQLLGLLFESLCIHDLGVYASLLPEAGSQPLRYYSDADGLEVDVIIELADGRWAAIEVKLGEAKVNEGVQNLKRLRKKIRANPAARNPDPEFMAVIVGKCEIGRYLNNDDIYIIPFGALTA